MKKQLLFCTILPIILMIFFGSCEPVTEPDEELGDPVAIYLTAESDTMLLLTGKSQNIKLNGIFTETVEAKVTNNGVLTEAVFTYLTTDTTIDRLSASQADWHSSNEDVVTVSAGEVAGVSPGQAQIWATYLELTSDTITIDVSSPQLPPDLIVDPPLMQLVFQDSSTVAGNITAGMDATLLINSDTVSYAANGRFAEVVYLDLGANTFLVKAINNNNNLYATRTKRITYLPMADAGITGRWEGETLTRPFGFDIVEQFGVFVLNGTMIVDFTMLGGPLMIQDIIIAGQVNPDGNIEAQLSGEYQGFTISGWLRGTFRDSGYANGRYGVMIEKPGWPTASTNAAWWAERQ